MTSRSDSESSASPIVVEPLRSEKTIVTVFRTSCGGAAGASGVPQKPQRRKRSGFSSPQEGHIAIRRVYVGFAGIFYAARRASRRRALPSGDPDGGRSTSSSAQSRRARAGSTGCELLAHVVAQVRERTRP